LPQTRGAGAVLERCAPCGATWCRKPVDPILVAWPRPSRDLEAKLRVPDLAYPVDVALDDRTFDALTTAAFRTPFGDVDVVLRPDAAGPRRYFTYEELNTRAHSREAFGVTIRVADLDDILESKTATGRPQDLAALPHLAALRAELARGGRAPEAAGDVEPPEPD